MKNMKNEKMEQMKMGEAARNKPNQDKPSAAAPLAPTEAFLRPGCQSNLPTKEQGTTPNAAVKKKKRGIDNEQIDTCKRQPRPAMDS